MTDFEDRIKREGRPFNLELITPAGGTSVSFDLDSGTYDTVAGFFKDKKLWVAGFRIECGAAETVDDLRFDDKIVWEPPQLPTPSADTGVDLSGDLIPDPTAGILVKAPSVKDKYGVQWLPVDFKVALANLGIVAQSKVTLWGVYTKRNL